ncbi:hypothetical protein Lesp02_28760 [Lentzea sp. NBRC 105346]|uniref:hypothetical protein n=1 Tax=Lentzea sp. NBRC 105346 TaxID=3032205 RepID=UPI0025561E3C|nr:hypothetical protein [Lentzea sp. NBRC 105346]GLZ30687.1 hypothetical protein Lesp02_28760 [Lentzea sp. NBRC 105346]
MIYLLAAIGALTVAVLVWRAFAPQQPEYTPGRRTIAPDDDPEFLRKLDEKRRKGTEE